MLDRLDRAAVLECQGRDDCRVLSVGLGSRADLRPVDEHLRDPAILEPADAAGIRLAVALKPEEPMGSSVFQPGSEVRHCGPPASPWAPKSFIGAPVWEGAPMGFLGA